MHRVKVTVTVDAYCDRLPDREELEEVAQATSQSMSLRFAAPRPLSREASFEELRDHVTGEKPR